MRLKDFIETYEGFDWNNCEIVVIDQRIGKSYLCKLKNGRLIHPYHLAVSKELEKSVYDWTHSEKTMVVTL